VYTFCAQVQLSGNREQAPSVLPSIDDDNTPDTLWVDRYRPTRFTDLLGNERIARETLAWIKLWDWCVFGKRPNAKRKATQEDDPLQYLDEFRRPQEKVCIIRNPLRGVPLT
jgi:chromosome transmission fidelity protein 18